MKAIKEDLIGLDDMSKVLDISPEGLRQRIFRDKDIPHYKVGGTLKFNKEEVLAYFKRGR